MASKKTTQSGRKRTIVNAGLFSENPAKRRKLNSNEHELDIDESIWNTSTTETDIKAIDGVIEEMKTQKISSNQEEEKETKMESHEFLSIISSDQHNKLSNIQHLILKLNDNMDYDQVFNQYLKHGIFEKMMPNLTKIESFSNFLFSEFYDGITHSKLKEITFTDCTEQIHLNVVNRLIVSYPSLKSIHAYCYYIDSNSFSNTKHNLKDINLLSYLPTVHMYINSGFKDIELLELNETLNLNTIHKKFNIDIIDPREVAAKLGLQSYINKDFRKIYCNDDDCQQDHISVFNSMHCLWCGIFFEKAQVPDPQKIIIKNKTKYWKDVEEYEDCNNDTKYLLQFPIKYNQVNETTYFDGFMFWSGMPDEPEPQHCFEETALFLQNPNEFKPDTIYYLTNQQCKLL